MHKVQKRLHEQHASCRQHDRHEDTQYRRSADRLPHRFHISCAEFLRGQHSKSGSHPEYEP